MLSRNEVGMRAGAAVAGKPQHARTQRGQHALLRWNRRGCGVERVEIRLHALEWMCVLPRLVAIDQMGVAYPKAEHESIGMSLRERMVRFGHLLCRMRPDTRNARRDDDALCRVKQLPGKLEERGAIGKPERAVAELLQLDRRLFRRAAIPPKGRAPDADSTKLHGGSSLSSASACGKSSRDTCQRER